MSIEKIKKGDELTQSKDLISENITNLKELFPEIITEDKINFKLLRDILGEDIEEEDEYYRFTWAGKSAARREAHKPSTGTLRPVKEESVDWDKTQNLYIEGDNLEVLKLLQKSYAGKIKMIYVDPPYNTGKDFVYKDDYKDNIRNYKTITGQLDSEGNRLVTNADTDGRYHSNWLNMLYPRLLLLRNLLREDGVIYISIDDNEVSNLRKLCDEVFGQDNFIGTFCIKSTPNARDYGHIGKMHEYCISYAKDVYETITFHLPDEKKTFKYEDEISGYNIHPLYNSNEAFHKLNRPNLYYPFYIYPDEPLDKNGFYMIGLQRTESSIEVFPPLSNKNSIQFVWRWGKEKAKENLNKEIVGYKTDEGKFRIVQKMRTSEKVIRSIFEGKTYTSRRGTAEVEEIFKAKLFSFPKPLALIKDLVQCSTENEDIVLDAFSGSATSAHAVMKQNIEDGCNRRHIQIQLPEKLPYDSEGIKHGYGTIADIGKDRIRKVAEIIKSNNIEVIKKKDFGLKVLKLDTSNIKGWDGKPENLTQNLLDSVTNIKEGRTEEDVLYEILLKYGLDLTLPIEERMIEDKKVFNVGLGALFICLADTISSKIAEGIGKWKAELNPDVCRVIFKDTGFTDVEKTNSVQTLKRFGIEEIKSI